MAEEKKAGKKEEKAEAPKEQFREDYFPAQVVELIGRTGARGEATQVRCKILDGRDKGKIIRRNVRGPTRIDDIVMLMETELEAAPLNPKRKIT